MRAAGCWRHTSSRLRDKLLGKILSNLSGKNRRATTRSSSKSIARNAASIFSSSADVNREAAERIIGSIVNPNLKEFSRYAKDAERAFLKAKQVYVVHVADCLVCSRKLVAPA